MAKADLTTATVECIAVSAQAAESKLSRERSYELPVTVDVEFSILDEVAYARVPNVGGTVAFEARTESGTVIASDKARFILTTGGKLGVVSGKISGLRPEEVERIREVVVRWLYGAQ